MSDKQYLQDQRVLAESKLYNERLKNDILRQKMKNLKIELKILDYKLQTNRERLNIFEFHFKNQVQDEIKKITKGSFFRRLNFLFKGE